MNGKILNGRPAFTRARTAQTRTKTVPGTEWVLPPPIDMIQDSTDPAQNIAPPVEKYQVPWPLTTPSAQLGVHQRGLAVVPSRQPGKLL